LHLGKKSAAADCVSDIAGVKSGMTERSPRIVQACRGPHPAGSPGMTAEQNPRATGF
jgi:hypothetical protein